MVAHDINKTKPSISKARKINVLFAIFIILLFFSCFAYVIRKKKPKRKRYLNVRDEKELLVPSTESISSDSKTNF